jgi:uncharacterized protein (UPF0147 family)
MLLPHGRDISSNQVELIVGREFPIRRFVSLCNSLVWATSKSRELAQTSFTERVLVSDSGIDAEWTIEMPEALPQGTLICHGWNVLQYKQRDVTSSDRQKIVTGLRRELRGAAQEVFTRTGNRPDHYSLFTNVDLTHKEKEDLKVVIREGFDHPLEVTIRGAAEVAVLLNDLPHLRSAFFSTDRFSTWERSWMNHETASITGKVPGLVGRAGNVREIKAAADDERIRVVVVTGPSGIGKNRLAFEATAHRPLDAIVSVDSELGVVDLLQTQSAGQNPIVIIDNPLPGQTRELIAAALGEGPKLILTITDPGAAQQFNFGQDSRVKVFALQPLSENDSRDLLRKAGANLDYSVESWVTQKAGGNASVLIAAAAVGQNLRVNGATFLDQVGDGLESRAKDLLGDNRLRLVRLLSVMRAVGITGSVAHELRTLCDTLGVVTPNDVLSNINPLTRSGFVRRVGNYLEVVPPVLANRAATLCLAGRERELTELLSALSASGRDRLLRRIQQLPGDTLRSFLAELFHHGPLRDFANALLNIQLLRLLAPVAPNEAVTLIEGGLSVMPVHQRLQLDASVRRDLVWTIEELLFRSRTSASALRCLRLLAEAETEHYSNNATHVFEECLYPLHPQLPLTLHDRLAAFRELLSENATKQHKMMAIKAAGSAFNSNQVSYFRRSDGPVPFDAVPTVTYSEVYEYLQTILAELRQLMQDPDEEVRTKAGETLVQALGEYTIRAQAAAGVQMLEEISPQIIARAIPIRLEDYVEALHLAQRGLTAHRPHVDKELARVSQLIDAIETGNVDTRVRRWVGTWDYGEQEPDENGELAYHGELEIRKLAQAAAADRSVISEDLLQWLKSKDAKRASEFFILLGRCDVTGTWEERIDRCGETNEGELAFACYYGGRGQVSRAQVEDKLDELTTAGRIRSEALLGATGYLPGSARAIARILILLERGVNPTLAERRLMSGGWMKPLDAAEGARLLRAIGDVGLENATAVVDFLAMWVQSKKPLEGDLAELAWQALESAPQGGEAWDFDILSAALAKTDLDRSFALLDRLLTIPSNAKNWEPLDRHSGNRFWNTLWNADRQRSLELLFRVGASSPLIAWRISWHIPDVLNLEEDRQFLQQFAGNDVRCGEFVSSCLTGGRPGFWPIALDLLAVYPDNRTVRKNIALAASHMNHTIVGPMSEHYIRCAVAVEEALHSENIPDTTRTFLRELAANLRKEAQNEHRDEQDESVNW